MRIHLIAIGGAVMHNLALELKFRGHDVSGSDDDIFEPSRTRLAASGLLPNEMGWHPDRIDGELDLIILGMHAREDNPELQRALELGIPVMSFPEFIASRSAEKKRIVVCGSHGKTTTTAMIMHVLRALNKQFDYLVGSKLEGFDRMVQLTDAPLIVIEGDEYLSSTLDPRPKFLWYDPDIAIITGIAWDHVNVFPTYDLYVKQFDQLIRTMRPESRLIYFNADPDLRDIVEHGACIKEEYKGLESAVIGNARYVLHNGEQYPMQLFGQHNFQNMDAAVRALQAIGVPIEQSLEALGGFGGTARRMELVREEPGFFVYRDFAHSPSKVRASVAAIREGYPEHHILAVLELHTFSSLSKDFLPLYSDTMSDADEALVFYSPENLVKKRRLPFAPADVESAFGEVDVFTDIQLLEDRLRAFNARPAVCLLMSSGSFEGADLTSVVGSAHRA
ncbi:MAG: peptidoglycan synthetase [Flavobacteriales bacterium]|nr:peptidoglycan synthetase [Flavobacteriales bacterium]